MIAVALVRPPLGNELPAALALPLTALGHRVVEITPRASVVDALLRPRKLGDDLGRFLPTLVGLRRARCEVAHVFGATDGLAAAVWAAHGGGHSVLTVETVPRREELAGRRLRLATLLRAIEGSAAVVANDPDVREGLERWLGVNAIVIPPEPVDDAAAAYSRLYGSLMGDHRPVAV